MQTSESSYPLLAELKSKISPTPMAMPAGYFDELSAEVMSKINAQSKPKPQSALWVIGLGQLVVGVFALLVVFQPLSQKSKIINNSSDYALSQIDESSLVEYIAESNIEEDPMVEYLGNNGLDINELPDESY